MKFNFRKIASVVSSGLMIGSTVALAAAANYPAPFVQGGNADVAIVVGANAATSDSAVAAVDVYSSLSNALLAQAGSSGSTSTATPSGGDYVRLARSSDNLNLGNNIATVYSSVLTRDDLPVLLADGTYSNRQNTEYKYEQRVTLGSGLQYNYFQSSDYQSRKPSLGINLTSNQLVLNYTLDFITDPESDLSSALRATDLETKNIKLLGKDYYILRADNDTGGSIGSIKLTLLDSAVTDIVREGEPKTLTVGDKSYDVSINFISTSSVKLQVNGEITDSLAAGGTFKLSDGTYVGIREINARDIVGSVGQVEFSLGAGKIELDDGNSIKINDKSINSVVAYTPQATGASSGKVRLDRITLTWTLDDKAFITPDKSLTLPGFNNIKFTMAPAVTSASPEVTTVENGGSQRIELKTTIKDGAVTLPLIYGNASGAFAGLGKDQGSLLVTSNISAATGQAVLYNRTRGDEFFVVSWNNSNTAESYILRFNNFVNDSGTERVNVQKLTDGNNWQTVQEGKASGDPITLGSLTLSIGKVNKPDQSINFTSSTAGVKFNRIYTKNGMEIDLPFFYPGGASTTASTQAGAIPINASFINGQVGIGASASSGIGFNSTGEGAVGSTSGTFVLHLRSEDRNQNLAQGSAFNVTIGSRSNGDLEANAIATGRETFTDPDDSNHITSRVYDDMGALLERQGDTSTARYATITYPSSETYGDVFLTTAAASITGSSGGSSAIGSIIVDDNEVQTVSAKNMIVIGGSCVNTVAASLLGSDRPLCGSDFTSKTGVSSGQFLIQTFASPFSSGKVATLVAGYEAADTMNAAKYVTSQTIDTTTGKKYRGTSATSATLVTT